MKPDLLHNERIATCSDMARLLYYGILGVVDDAGRAKAAAAYLHGQVFWGRPRPLAKVEAALAELVKGRILRVYEADGGRYLEIIGWRDPGEITHQRIDKPQHSTVPAPSADYSANGSEIDRGTIPGGVAYGKEQGQEQEQEQEQIALGGPIADVPTPGQDLKATIACFHDRYVAAYGGAKPTWGPGPSKLLKNLIKQHGATEVQRRIGILFDSPPSWMEPPFTVGSLSSAFDRLVVAMVPRKGPIPARHPNAPTDFFGALDDARDDLKKKGGGS